jgi:nitroreductase
VPDTIDFLKTRRSVKPREMSGPGPSPTELESILTVGARVPDHGKLAPWRFIIFEGDARARAGASAMNIVTAATALGYGANWLTGWFAFDRDVLDGLGLKADEKIAGFIHIGTPSKPNEDRPRPALSDIVTRF